jgi:hypothetical protein
MPGSSREPTTKQDRMDAIHYTEGATDPLNDVTPF